jgi:hypothetical protein
MYPEYPRLRRRLPDIVRVLDSELRLPSMPLELRCKTRVVVDIPYAAETDERCASSWPRAFVVDPRQDLGTIDEVRVWGEWHSGEGLALSLCIVCVRGLALGIPGFCGGGLTVCRDLRGKQRSTIDS